MLVPTQEEELANVLALRRSLNDPNAQLSSSYYGQYQGGFSLPPINQMLSDSPENQETLNLASEAQGLVPSVISPASPSDVSGLQARFADAKTQAFPQTQPTTKTRTTTDKFFFTKQGGTVRYFDKDGNELSTNPIGGDQYRNNPEQDPNFGRGNLIEVGAPPTKARATATNAVTEVGAGMGLAGFFGDEYNEIQLQSEEAEKNKADLDALSSQFDTITANFIQNTKNKYDTLIKEQEKINASFEAGITKAGIRGGRSRYAPEEALSEVNAEVRNGLDRIKKLNEDRDALILQAESDNLKGKWDRLYKSMDMLDKNQESSRKAVLDLFKTVSDLETAVQNRAKSMQDALQTSVEITKKVVDSAASYADVGLATFEAAEDEEGATRFLEEQALELRERYGIEITAKDLYNGILEVRKKDKGFSDPYELPGVGLVQINSQTGEIRTLGTKQRQIIRTNPITGEQEIVTLNDTDAVGGIPTPSGDQPQVPPQLQPSIQQIGGQKYFDEGRLVNQAQKTMAQRLATELGIPYVSKQDAQLLKNTQEAANQALSQLGEIKSYVNELITAKEGGQLDTFLGTRLQGIGLRLSALTGADARAKAFLSSLKVFSTPLSKATGQVGVLTEQDILAIKNALPTPEDTVESAAEKLRVFESLFWNKIESAAKIRLGLTPSLLGGGGNFGSLENSGTTSSGIKFTIEE